MELIEQPSGLLIPKPTPKEPPREWGPLEVTDEVSRKVLQAFFQRILNATCCRDWGAMVDGKETARARKDLLLTTAKLLLGSDFTYDELT